MGGEHVVELVESFDGSHEDRVVAEDLVDLPLDAAVLLRADDAVQAAERITAATATEKHPPLVLLPARHLP